MSPKETTMRLRLIQEADFRKNEVTNYEIVKKKYKMKLGPRDVICLYSQSGTQVVFVYRPVKVDFGDSNRRAGDALIFRSERLRLSNRTWDPLMLQNYANQVGLQLDYIKRFEVFMRELGAETPRRAAKTVKNPRSHLSLVA